jgi:serine/threonine-protein kinase
LALAMDPTTAALSIWIKRLDREPAIRLTIDTADNAGPAWTPDGRSVTYSSDAGGGAWRLWTKRADGTSPAVLQAHEPRNLFGSHWSPDGKWLVFQSDPEQKGAGDILGMRPGIDSAPVPLIATNFSEVAPAISPDGRWLAYESNETGQYEVYVVPFPKMGPGKWAVSSAGGTEPLWSHTGKELFYRDGAGNLRAVKVKSKPTFSAAGSTVLFPAADFFALPFAAQYAVSPDDQRFVMVRTVGATTADKLIVVDNWFEELRGKVGHK